MNLGTKRQSNLSTVPIVSMFLTHTKLKGTTSANYSSSQILLLFLSLALQIALDVTLEKHTIIPLIIHPADHMYSFSPEMPELS